MPSVAIAGATGYLGSHLVRAFVAEGFEVAILKRRTSSLERLQSVLGQVSLHEVDGEREEGEIARLRPDVVIHAATCYGRKGESSATIAEANLGFPARLLDAAAAAGVRAFVNVDTILPPQVNEYARTKHEFRRRATERLQGSATAFVNVRMAMMYGPWDDDSKVTTKVIRSCAANVPTFPLTRGEQRRDFVYIDDVAAAFMAMGRWAVTSARPHTEFDLGTGVPTTIRSFAEMAHRLTASTTRLDFGAIPYRAGDPMESPPLDMSQLAALGWKARHDVASGIAATIAAEGLR